MLTGQESLIRLVGKRRRTISLDLLQLLHTQENVTGDADPSSSTGKADSPEGSCSVNPARGVVEEVHDSRQVTCPVCGTTIRGSDQAMNFHLDTCLVSGSKRKLTQSTLLQFSFCPRPRIETCSDDPNNLKQNFRRDLDDGNDPKNTLILSICSTGNSEENDSVPNSPVHLLSSCEACFDAPIHDCITENALSCKVIKPISSYLSSEGTKMSNPAAPGEKDDNAVRMLETLIVGRRFHENNLLEQGSHLSLLRDLQNPKDSNAIKVLCADTESGGMLGYLPRELAKFLSPPLDNQYVKCEGSIISLPRNSLDNVPIQLACQSTIAYAELDPMDQQSFEIMWENFLRVTEDMNTSPSSMPKYQKNFHLMIDDVMEYHGHLFTDEEKMFLGSFDSFSDDAQRHFIRLYTRKGSFDSFSDDAQRLFIRLYTRKGPWFRISSFSYPEISELHNAVEELWLAGYFCSFHSAEVPFEYDMNEVLSILSVSELREISNLKFSKKGMNNARRQELVNLLVSAYEDGTCGMLLEMVLQRAGICVKISSTADILLWRIQRLFFLNGDQDLSAFLLVDLGLIKFPTYTCNVSCQIFQDRDHLLEYEEAVQVAQVMDQSLDENKMEIVMNCIKISHTRINYCSRQSRSSVSDSPTASFFSCFSASWVYSKVLTLGVSVYEHEHRYKDAVNLLKDLLKRMTNDRRRGYWALRLSVDLEHMGYVNESLSVSEEGVLDPWVRAGSKLALQRRVLRLSKPPRRWKTPSYAESVKRKIKEVNVRGRPLNCGLGVKNIFYGYDGKQCGVEQLALQYYAREGGGWQGVHSESGIWMTIFGFLMWDVIFSDVPDVFRSKFQTAPLDLGTDDFYVSRKSLIESQLQKIHKGSGEEILITSWETHMGTACKGVTWDRYSLTDLRAVVSCIGGPCLASLCRHLAQDYRSWSSGMPDLLLWQFHGGDGNGGKAKLVEVKGPSDRLSEQQRAWLLVLMDWGFDAEVCKVSANESNKRGKRKLECEG